MKKTIILAFDIERTGAKPENETIAIGVSVVDENLKQLDSALFKGYIRRPLPEGPATPANAPPGFEPRSWIEFWHDKREHLKRFTVDGDFTNVSGLMIRAFQEFRRKWERLAEEQGAVLEVVSDNPTYDCWFINELICKHTTDHPLPYMASRIEYQPLWDSDSMLRGILAAVDPDFKGPWDASTRIRELYDVDGIDNRVGYAHMPDQDAYNIACDAQIVLGIRNGRFQRRQQTFVISMSSCGDASAQIVQATNEYAVMRHILKTNPYFNEYYCDEMELEPTNTNALIVALAKVTGWEQVLDTDLEDYIGMSEEDIIYSLNDPDTKALFEYMFTGGEGDQRGNPGKEWTTYTVEKLDLTNVLTV